MSTVLAMLLGIEQGDIATFYLPQEKNEVKFVVNEDLIAEFTAAMAEEESYFVTIDPEMKQVV